MTILITTCSKRKQSKGGAQLPAGEPFKTQEELLTCWQQALQEVPKEEYVEAAMQYQGRGFRQALHMVQGDLTKLYVASAGLGLVHADQAIPGYNFTVSAGNQSARDVLPYVTFDFQQWFSDMCAHGVELNLEDILLDPKTQHEYIVLALSRPYLQLMLADLEKLHEKFPEKFSRIRIIGSNLEEIAPYWMFEYLMPYTASAAGVVGSKIDFAQRATQHFISGILDVDSGEATGSMVSAVVHGKAVFKALPAFLEANASMSVGFDSSVKRVKLTDEDLEKFVLEEWENCFGSKTRLLYTLRKGRGLSCSMERFGKIYERVLASRA